MISSQMLMVLLRLVGRTLDGGHQPMPEPWASEAESPEMAGKLVAEPQLEGDPFCSRWVKVDE